MDFSISNLVGRENFQIKKVNTLEDFKMGKRREKVCLNGKTETDFKGTMIMIRKMGKADL